MIGFGYPVVPEGEARLRVQIRRLTRTSTLIAWFMRSGNPSRRGSLNISLDESRGDDGIDGFSVERLALILMAFQLDPTMQVVLRHRSRLQGLTR